MKERRKGERKKEKDKRRRRNEGKKERRTSLSKVKRTGPGPKTQKHKSTKSTKAAQRLTTWKATVTAEHYFPLHFEH